MSDVRDGRYKAEKTVTIIDKKSHRKKTGPVSKTPYCRNVSKTSDLNNDVDSESNLAIEAADAEDGSEKKKIRKRRSFKELVRNIECRWEGCGRVYATESSLQVYYTVFYSSHLYQPTHMLSL